MGDEVLLADSFVLASDRLRSAAAAVDRASRTHAACLRHVVHTTSEIDLLSSVCSTIVGTGHYLLAWCGRHSRGANVSLSPVACAISGVPSEVCPPATAADLAAPGTPSETAFRLQRPIVVHAGSSRPAPTAWRKRTQELGLVTCCSQPLLVEESCLGVLEIYSSETTAFGDEEAQFFHDLANDLAAAVAALRSREQQSRQLEVLRSHKDRSARLSLMANELITIVDRDCVRLHISGPVERMFGYSADELIGTSAFDSAHPDDRDAVWNQFAELATHPGATKRTELRICHKNGTWADMEVVGTNLCHDPLVRGIVLTTRSLGERNTLQAQLHQAVKMEAVGRLAGGVAHDFNNLLTTISGNVELAKADLEPSHAVMAYLDDTARAAQSAADLTRQLLAFSRRQIIQPRVLSLNDLIGTLQRMLARLIRTDIALEVSLAPDLEAVRVDPGQFQQVLVNLVVNARDAMAGGGTIRIETANVELDAEYCVVHPYVEAGRYVMLAVSDTGCGIDEETRRHIFEPFFTTKPMWQGTGLGLSTTFGSVKQAGGSIEVDSRVGMGTTFRIFLPHVGKPPESLAQSREDAIPPTGCETILLVDDNDSTRTVATRMLTRLGYDVIGASTGAEALALVEHDETAIHLLISDVVMPAMNGPELAKRVAAVRPRVKVLFTSGYTENAIANHGMIDERVSFIAKPFSLQTLAHKVREVLQAG